MSEVKTGGRVMMYWADSLFRGETDKAKGYFLQMKKMSMEYNNLCFDLDKYKVKYKEHGN